MVQFLRINTWAFMAMMAMMSLNTSCNPGQDDHQAQSKESLFEKVDSERSNIVFRNDVVQTRYNNHIVNVEFISGGGVAVGDVNADGLPDLFFTGNQIADRLYLNQGNLVFSDISERAGIGQDTLWSSGVTFVDIDQDGDEDIYVCRNVYLEDENSANQLYVNNGDLTFTESAFEFGIADRGFSTQAIFFDYNNDGLIDLYLVNLPPSLPGVGGQLDKSMGANPLFSDKLYKNTGKRFVDVTDASGVRNFAFGLSASTGDFNDDGWIDVYVTNDFNEPDHLYMNQKDGTFRDMVHEQVKHISNFSMGSDVADYDNDGHLDVLVVDMVAEDHKRIKTHMGAMKPEVFWEQVATGRHYQYMFNTLQRNRGDGFFNDLAQLGGVSNTDWSWAPLFADFDNDGFKDIFVTNGVKNNNRYSDLQKVYDAMLDSLNNVAMQSGLPPSEVIDVMDFVNLAPSDPLPNYIFKNNGDLTFSKKIVEWGMSEPTMSNGAAYADLDADGDLDLVINNIDAEASIYENTAAQKALGNYLRVQLNGSEDQSVYGAKVLLYQGDKLWQIVQISNARGYMSKSEDVAHFGLGEESLVDKVEVIWLDKSVSTLHDVQANQHITVDHSDAAGAEEKRENEPPLFAESFDLLDSGSTLHQENEYDDYALEVLLPHKMSEFGPCLAVGDVDGDQLEDFFVGGSAGHAGKLYRQNDAGTFEVDKNGAWDSDLFSEDMGAAFFDVDGDSDLDLFVVSGGNEFVVDADELQDRVYLNDGHGVFTKRVEALPEYLTSGSCVVPFDFDGDGDLDVFVGGRLIPGQYPRPANSHLLENQEGNFVEVTAEKAPELRELGLVTAARSRDMDKNGEVDLVIVGEWMPVTILYQQEGTFNRRETLLDRTSGWYYSVAIDDMDSDGDLDIIAGNLGLNYKYKASDGEPFEVYSDDFDQNGSLDIVLSYYEHGEIFPVRGKDCSSQQIPTLKDKFPTYESFGSANLTDIYGLSLENALNRRADTFASIYIENTGSNFKISPLPNLAQTSSINNILIDDYNLDGYKDILISGNLYQSEIETPRNDAGYGLLLCGDGKGKFEPKSPAESGFLAPHDAKDMQRIKAGGKQFILVANNQQYLQTLEVLRGVDL